MSKEPIVWGTKAKYQRKDLKVGKLDQAIVYLSGSMEAVADHGVGWRRKFIELSDLGGLDISFIDPTNKPGPPELKVGEDKAHQEMLQKEGRFEELRDYVADYRRYDLRACDYMDALVAYINPAVPHWGTPNEIYVAEAAHKPRFCVIEGGLSKLPRWLFDVFPLDHVFETLDDCIQRLVSLDDGTIPMSREWVLIRKYIISNRSSRP